jgi:hypothetical protein
VAAPRDPLAFLHTGGLSGVFVTDSPMTRLASEVYAMLEPYAEQDAAYGWALRSLVESITKMYTDVDELVRTSADGDDPPWSAAMDATRVPTEGMAWLGQLIGVTVLPADSFDISRQKLASAATGIRRGSLVQMKLAAQQLLTGTQTVVVSERTSDAWHFAVRTRVSETPSSAAVLAALTAQKPAGLIMDYNTYSGLLYQETSALYASYTASTAGKATYTIRSA